MGDHMSRRMNLNPPFNPYTDLQALVGFDSLLRVSSKTLKRAAEYELVGPRYRSLHLLRSLSVHTRSVTSRKCSAVTAESQDCH